MTKYEWEKELKKNIHRLPDDEIGRVTDYYDELFEDNIERGKSEREIISEFGNPADVADRILSEYDGELKPDSVFDVPPTLGNRSNDGARRDRSDEKPDRAKPINVFDEYPDDNSTAGKADKKRAADDGDKSEVDLRGVKLAVFMIFNFFTGFALFIVAAVVWIVLGAFTIAFGGISVGGIGVSIIGFGPLFGGSIGSGLAQVGIGIALIGCGILGVFVCVRAMRLYAKLTAYCWKLLRA